MFHHSAISLTTAVAVFLWAASAAAPGWAQHGGHGGGHAGSGHGGSGHAGSGHAGSGHAGSGHAGSRHDGGGGYYGGSGRHGGSGYHGSGLHGYGGRLHTYHGYGGYGRHSAYTYYDSPTYSSLYYAPWYGYYGYAYYDSRPRYRVAYDPDSYLPYASATLAQGCRPRGCGAGADPAELVPPRTGRSGRSAAGAQTDQLQPDYQRRAEDAFQVGRYDQALRLGNHALVETPRNGKLHLFVSQILFATGDYPGAAAAIHRGASLLEPKDWGYVVENFRKYYRSKDYVKQMERLTKFIEANPDAAYAHFLRGYHYGYIGHKETARRDLAKAVELEGRDKLAAQLLEMFGGERPPGPDKPEAGDSPINAGDATSAPQSTGREQHQDEHSDHQH